MISAKLPTALARITKRKIATNDKRLLRLPTFEIYRSTALVARAGTGFSRHCCFVTFEPLGYSTDLDRAAFGEHFLADKRIDAVHILPADNDWYQHPDFLEACRQVAEITRHYERVVAYGSSMGGYAAIRFGGLVGAQTAFALSPQFSIDPRLVPFEGRWREQARALTFANERSASRFVASAYIAYEPRGPDARHADLFRSHTNVVDIRIPNCGHPSTHYLAELGLLQAAVVDLANGTFDPVELRRQARQRRKDSPDFYLSLSYRARSETLRLALAERAVAQAPTDIRGLTHFGVLAAHAGRIGEAFEALDRAAAVDRHHPVVRRAYSEVHEIAGDLDRALTILEELCNDPIPSEKGDRPRLTHLKRRRRFALYRVLTNPTVLRRLGRRLDRLGRRLGLVR